MPTIEVRSQVFGGHQDSPSLKPILLNILQERLSVAELIQRSVEEQIRSLLVQRQMDAQQVRRVLDRHYLTAAEIAAQAQQGAIRYPSERVTQVPQIDRRSEIKKALCAFEVGSYIILVNGQQVESLDEELTLSLNTKVIFLRLMPLVGG